MARHRHDVAGELVAGLGLGHEDRGLVDRFVCQQGGLDLTELDALTAELHLEVGAADVLELAVAVPRHQVAGAVHPIARCTERVGDEPVGREIGSPDVTARELDTREVELTRDTHRNRPQTTVEHVCADVPLGYTDRHDVDRSLGGRLPVGGRDRGLGRSVEVVDVRGADPAHTVDRLGRQGLTDDEDVAQCAARGGVGVRGEDGEHRRHEVGDGHLLAGDDLRQVGRVAVAVGGGDHEFRADAQRHEEAPQRHVEGRRGLLEVHVLRGHLEFVQHPLRLIDDRAVRHGHALRPSGGTGGEDRVGGVVGTQRREPVLVADRCRRHVREVETVDLHRVDGDARRDLELVARRGHDAHRIGGVEDVADAVGRMIRVDRHPGAAGPHDRVHAHEQFRGAADGEADQRLRSHAVADQVPGETVDPRVELGVGQFLAS